MAPEKLVYIIGAGASKEANLPTGEELKPRISSLLDIQFDGLRGPQISGDHAIFGAISSLCQLSNENTAAFVQAAYKIRDALPQAESIDTLIDSHRGDEKIATCAKLAIISSILTAEKDSLLNFDRYGQIPQNTFKMLDAIWYSQFFKILISGCNKADLESRLKSLVLIIFNYDRCVEHFLYHALMNFYPVTESEAENLVKSIEIFHPYGAVGSLPWKGNQDHVTAFGAVPETHSLLDLLSEIKTFTEGVDSKYSDIESIRDYVDNAKKLIFIGFAFHELNMNLLFPDKRPHNEKVSPECFASSYNISGSNTGSIQRDLHHRIGDKVNIHLINNTCCEFFKECSRSLRF